MQVIYLPAKQKKDTWGGLRDFLEGAGTLAGSISGVKKKRAETRFLQDVLGAESPEVARLALEQIEAEKEEQRQKGILKNIFAGFNPNAPYTGEINPRLMLAGVLPEKPKAPERYTREWWISQGLTDDEADTAMRNRAGLGEGKTATKEVSQSQARATVNQWFDPYTVMSQPNIQEYVNSRWEDYKVLTGYDKLNDDEKRTLEVIYDAKVEAAGAPRRRGTGTGKMDVGGQGKGEIPTRKRSGYVEGTAEKMMKDARKLTPAMAREFLKAHNGDREAAMEDAFKRGFWW